MIEDKKTLLPFYDVFTATKLFLVIAILLVIFVIVKAVIYRRSVSLHRAPTAVLFAYIAASLINLLLCTFLYWYWAAPMCAVITVIYIFVSNGEVRDANRDERIGVWGFNSEMRKIRGELFNDMSIEQQLEYRSKTRDYSYSRLLMAVITLAVPALFVLLCRLADIGYLFFPVIIQE